jgi:tetratricopeptide (TPR) repeat protein
VLLALVPRLAYLAQTAHLPYFADFFLDGDWYRQRAREALAGEWLSAASHFRGPLYPWFLAGLFRLFGESVHPVRVAQLLLGAANAGLVWAAARRFVSPSGALLAALLYAGYGILVYFDGEILTLTLETTLLLLFLLALTARGRAGAPLAGLLLGASAILRPSILPLAIPALLYLRPSGDGAPRRAPGRRLGPAAFLVALALPILPVVVGYRIVLGDWIPISSQGGINFYLGNHEGADGSASIAPCTGDIDLTIGDRYRDTVDECSRRVAERALGRPLAPSEVSRYWMQRGLAFARERPVESAALFLKRLYLVVANQEIDNNQDVPYFLAHQAPWVPRMPVGAGILFALGLPGAVWFGRRSREGRFALLAAIVLALATATFLVMSRYRVPVLLLLLPYAGETLVVLAQGVRERLWRPFEGRLLVVLVLLVVTTAGLHRVGSDDVRAAQHVTLGFADERAGNHEAAAAAYRRAVLFDPNFLPARYALGNALARLGRAEEARRELETLVAADARYEPFAANTIGILALDAGDVEGAIAAFRRAVAGDPAPTTRANLGVALLAAGRAAEALPELEAAWASGAVPGEVGVDLARARLDVGDTTRAEADLSALLAREPGLVRGWMLLAQNHRARGERAGEVDALRRALRAEPGLGEALARLAELGERP